MTTNGISRRDFLRMVGAGGAATFALAACAAPVAPAGDVTPSKRLTMIASAGVA